MSECENCEGTGKVWVTSFAAVPPDEQVECEVCQGAGETDEEWVDDWDDDDYDDDDWDDIEGVEF